MGIWKLTYICQYLSNKISNYLMKCRFFLIENRIIKNGISFTD